MRLTSARWTRPNVQAEDDRMVALLRADLAAQSQGHFLSQTAIEQAAQHLPTDAALQGSGPADDDTEPVLIRLDPDSSPPAHRRRLPAAAAAAVIVVAAAGVVIAGYSRHDHLASPGSGAQSACAHAVVTSALPVWAQSGFAANALVNAHLTGASGNIIGVLFADHITAPARANEANKILWVSRLPVDPNQPLTIRARLDDSSAQVTRTIAGGPGPSTLDLPKPGCWNLTLSWSGHQDAVRLPVVTP